jgi:hypothetical protein
MLSHAFPCLSAMEIIKKCPPNVSYIQNSYVLHLILKLIVNTGSWVGIIFIGFQQQAAARASYKLYMC